MRTIAELLDLTGKSAIVTGGAKGIGSGICHRLAEAGASVVVADIDFPAAEATAQSLREHGWIAVAHKADVASKHGAWGFTKNAALELAPYDVTVNAIAPGGVRTPGTGTLGLPDEQLAAALEEFSARIPMGRMGEPDDIGTVALFLASGLARYVTGAQLVVDGGVLLR